MLRLEIVTPEKKVFDADVETVTIPTASGEAGLLANHAPIVSALKPGILSYTLKGTVERMVVSGGFIEMSNNKVSVLTDSAETATEIDLEAARAAREAAEKELAANATSAIELTEVTREQLDAANARIQLAAGK
ncbi:MAG TPA: F0F1 ATP synthase subunit epsilon [Pyrinomonadaceae bacterium]